jgi:SdrD B-like domain/Secretion system C-terminal sorting domain
LKNFSKQILVLLTLVIVNNASAQITGNVFRDYNANGVRGTASPNNEPGVAGIIVNAYNASDALIASYVTGNTGDYSIPNSGTYNGTPGSNTGSVPSGTNVRIEFIIPTNGTTCDLSPTIDYSSARGAGNATSVQFVTGGASAISVNYGINNPGDYTAGTNPDMVMPAFINGNPLAATGTSTTDDAFVGFPYNSSGNTTPPKLLNGQTIGACWGVAYSKHANKVFTSAFLKRHAGLGTMGTGGIYILTPTATSFTAATFYDMDANNHRTRAAATGTPAYGVGSSFNFVGNDSVTYLGTTDPESGAPAGLGVIGSNTDRGLPNNNTVDSYDPAAFAQVGKVGLGDLEISDDGRFLFVTNLYNRRIYCLELNSASNPTSVTAVTSYALPAATATNGVLRPFGLKYSRGKLYVGAVATGENGGTAADLRAYVFVLNNPTGTASFAATNAISFPLNYTKGYAITWSGTHGNAWNPWISNTNAPSIVGPAGINLTAAAPILSDIEFDERGTMIISLMDRAGHQFGENNLRRLRISTDGMKYTIGGDIIAAKNNCNGTYTTESNGQFVAANGTTYTSGTANNNGIGGSEFFKGDNYTGFHEETNTGALAFLLGSNEVYASLMDPTNAVNTGGVARLSMVDGSKTLANAYQITGANEAGWGKSNSLGDLEILGALQPVEIGNRLWNDANGDGIQNPGEAGIANVILELTNADGSAVDSDPSTAGIQATLVTTDANGNWIISSAAGTDATGANYGVALLPNTNYVVKLATAGTGNDWDPTANGGAGGPRTGGQLVGLQLTTTNKIGNGALDLSDNDASLVSSIPQITFTTGNYGENNHTLDIGFKPLASLGDKVWRDDDKDGVQDAGEPGVAGVTVTLYNSTGGVVATTVTDAYGNYLFDNLTPADYSVGFTPPANYTFATSTGTSEADATNSDVNATTGRTTTVTLSAGENQRNIDAGLIFSQPTVNSIGDKVWFDTDTDGTQDANEAGVSGVTVTLYNSAGTVVATTVTDANGNYLFNNLPDGNYRVGFTLPTGMLFTTKGADNTSGGASDSDTDSDVNTSGINFGKTDLINLDAAGTNTNGVNYTDVDAGLLQQSAAKASLGDRVWNDLDNDGIQDAGEPGIEGVTVTLYAADGVTVVATTVTDAFGNYIFNNLDAGNYIVGFGTAPGFNRSTIVNTGTNDFGDNDANATTGRTAVYNLVAGQRNLSVDAAYRSTSANTGRLGNYVWFDADKDGVQDAGEAPVGGVTVILYNSTGTPVDTTATDANGLYQFINLAAGTYSVGFTNLPAGLSFTASTGTTSASNTTNSDANPATGRTASFALAAGGNLQGLDAGLIAGVASGLGSLGNKIWWDLDGDNVQDAGEPGTPGVTVTLLDYGLDGAAGGGDDGPSRTTVTNALGEYIFTGLPAGNYAVQFGTGNTLPAGATAVTQNSGGNDAIDSDGAAIAGGTSTTAVYRLGAGEDNLTVDLGIRNTARGSFGNRVWYDNGTGGGVANDGIQNGGEIGVAGVMVTLVNAAGQPVDRAGTVTTTPIVTTTDANGYYSFADLTAGVAFAARFSNLPAGFDYTSKVGAGSGDDNRSDADLVSGLTPTVTIVANNHSLTLDAGITSTRAALGNYVWLDDNGDGVQDATEPGVPGVTVTLYRPGFGLDGITGNADDALPVASMITDQNGQYLFNNLLPGTYEVAFGTLPSGLTFTQQNTPGDNGNNTNSDANPATGRTTGITLTAGEVDLTVDAGLFRPRAVIGNYVWVDQNGNGVQDATEQPAPGVMVTLLNSAGNAVAVAITDANGNYLFPNVAPGTYSLSFTNLPQGSSFTTPDLGGNDQADSDVSGTTITGIVVTTTTNNLSFDAGIVNFSLLPVQLIGFNAAPQGNTVLLSWEVTAELNLADYVVEHSADGSNFGSIGSMAATGSSKYSLNHATPVKGLNYYRLKMRDKDGSFTYSAVRVVNLGQGMTVKLYPNPVSDILFVTLSANFTGKAASIIVTAMDGRRMLQQNLLVAGQTEQVNVKALPAGKYVLQLATAAETITQTFVVTR